MKDVSALSENTPRRTGTRDQYAAVNKARTYLAAFSQKRRILAETEAKVDALEELAPCIHAAARTIVFTETIEAAQSAADILCRAGIATKAIHSQLDKPDRKQVLAAFATGSLHAITAPKVLDEGIDVPEADLAIIFATSKTRRQMVQRMGRVLRRKKDGRLARFILLYVEGTTEAPENGAHESFLNEITEVADDVQAFNSETEWDEIIEYVNDFVGSPGQPPPRMAR
jgi:superfamily II DNA or RNA helicase